jgi:hypothetical protein
MRCLIDGGLGTCPRPDAPTSCCPPVAGDNASLTKSPPPPALGPPETTPHSRNRDAPLHARRGGCNLHKCGFTSVVFREKAAGHHRHQRRVKAIQGISGRQRRVNREVNLQTRSLDTYLNSF